MVNSTGNSKKVLLPWQQALKEYISDLKLTSDGIGLFVLQLKFNVDDITNIASEAITGGGDDKKCDLLFIEPERKFAVIMQCYMSEKDKQAAPSNKASDLNTAIPWLITTPLERVPESLRGRAAELREAITSGAIKTLHIMYVHNLPESKNVRDELGTVAHATSTALKALAPSEAITIFTDEVGSSAIADLYNQAAKTIAVTDDITFYTRQVFEVQGGKWSSLVTVIDGVTLFKLYDKHKTNLFSANLRDYLGSRDSDQNINNGIKVSARDNPGDFWVYNNGLTALTMSYEIGRKTKKGFKVKISGISIVNGAQTTGSVGTLSNQPDEELTIPIRFVKTVENTIIENIIRFNNSQNKVLASDFRSTDSTQTRLVQEFIKIPDADYNGGRRGGAADAMRRRKNVLASYTVGQALASFHGDPVLAYNEKAEIWINDGYYLRYFNEKTTAPHIVFVYTILEALNREKMALIEKSKKDDALSAQERLQMQFLNRRGASYLLVAAVSASMETILGRALPNKFEIRFKANLSPDRAIENWKEILGIILALSQQLDNAFIKSRISNDKLKESLSGFSGVVTSLKKGYQPIFDTFKELVHLKDIT